MKKDEKMDEGPIFIEAINIGTINVNLEALPGSTYIQHRFSMQTIEDIVERELAGAVTKKPKRKYRSLDEEYESCFWYTDDGKNAIPTAAFIGAIMFAVTDLTISKALVKRTVRILGEVVPIRFKKINRRIDRAVRGTFKVPDIRHRPEFVDWSCTVPVTYNADTITADQVVNLFNIAGFSSGIGDWRPSSPKSSGQHGMFKVVPTGRAYVK